MIDAGTRLGREVHRASGATPRGERAHTQQAEIALEGDPLDWLRAHGGDSGFTFFLDGRGGFTDAWRPGPLLAISPTCAGRVDRGAGKAALEQAWTRLAERVESRRGSGTAETGVAALLAYDVAETPRSAGAGEDWPVVVVLEVDRTIRWVAPDVGRLSVRGRAGEDAAARRELDAMMTRLSGGARHAEARPARIVGRPETSLPHEAYLRAVATVKRHIARGDIYQANLCQHFIARFGGDPLALYGLLRERAPAPRSAWFGTPWFALASISPETFLRVVDGDWIETWPIKGTRPRGATPELDRAAAEALLASEKDRAELLMIVDLERNDLSRISCPGTVHVPELAGLRSFATVHHLVACVRGRLREGTDAAAILRATFPGGSITGAPKLRAMQILRDVEPVSRHFFTGALVWFGDDGTIDSSILIRSLVFGRERVCLGAGGGIVADSDPEDEWRESNHKARALAEALGFAPDAP